MVDRIDRSDAPPPYYITRPKDAKESQHQQSEQREEQEKRYQKENAEQAWGKFDRRERTVRALRVSRDQIARCLFRQVVLHSGVGTLQIDVLWRDGRRTNGALVLLRRLEEYLRLKRFTPGQEVPDEFWSRGTMVELGIVQLVGAAVPPMPRAGPSPGGPSVALSKPPHAWLRALRVIDVEGRHIRWGMVALYATGAAVAAIAIILIAT